MVKKIVLVTKTAVNIEQIIPTLNVVANPFIGPEPIKERIKAVISVVTLASRIVIKAILYPLLIEAIVLLPNFTSSLILSKIIILASTVIPIVSSSPAIPGNVKIASIVTRMATTIDIFIISAILAINPDRL